MKKRATLIIGGGIILILLLIMFTYTVPFDHAAVVQTFGQADIESVRNADGKGAGLYLRWPWPIQNVRLFDRRIQTLEVELEERQTRDEKTVTVQLYMAWRIAAPLTFFQSLRTLPNARRKLQIQLRAESGKEIAQYALDELTTGRKLAEAEKKIRNIIEEQVKDYGVHVEAVGIKRLMLPQGVTEKVFETMRKTRLRLAQKSRSEGEAIAKEIEASARRDAEIIRSFAERRAQAIRREGDEAAAETYAIFERNPRFAGFLLTLETLRMVLKENTTFVFDSLDPGDWLNSLNQPPEAFANPNDLQPIVPTGEALLPLETLPRALRIPIAGARPLELVLVSPGRFRIGSKDGEPEEQPVREVSLSRPFFIGRYEVTVGQFAAFLRNASSDVIRSPMDDRPVVNVSHEAARAFARWLISRSGLHVELPSEVEWEYAARGPESRKYPWGNEWEEGRCHAGDEDGPTAVGSYPDGKSWCGAQDMAGNVFEWCADYYDKFRYQQLAARDPGISRHNRSAGMRVIRGGSFGNGDYVCRAAYRNGMAADHSDSALGFRIKVRATRAVHQYDATRDAPPPATNKKAP